MKLRLYLADMMEPQANGKLAALGLFPDLVVVLTVPPGSPDPTPQAAFGTDLCLMLTITGLPAGDTIGEMQLLAPTPEPMPVLKARFPFHVPKGSTGLNVPLPMKPMPVPALGVYTVELRVGNDVLRETFEIQVKLDPAAPPPMLLAPVSAGGGAPTASTGQTPRPN